jgi:hypothetical protein
MGRLAVDGEKRRVGAAYAIRALRHLCLSIGRLETEDPRCGLGVC